MAFAHVQSMTPDAPGSEDPVINTLVGATAGNLIVVSIGITVETVTLTSLTDDRGNTYTPIHNQIDHSGVSAIRAWMYYTIAGVTGDTVITADFSGNVTGGIHVDEYSFGGTLEVIDTSTGESAVADTTPDAGSLVTTQAAGLLYVFYRCISNVSFTQGTSFNNRGATARTDAQDRIVSSADTYATAATYGGNSEWLGLAVAFQEAAAASGNRRRRLLMGGSR